MKNILIISYNWLPRGAVGMLRMARFAKYLVNFGYNVSVMTSDVSSEGKIYLDIDGPAFKKVKVYKIKLPGRPSLSDYIAGRIHPQLEPDWFSAAKEQLDTLLERIEFDIVISSSPPESAHQIAATIKERCEKPWIADLRDLWSCDHYRNFGFLRRSLITPLEKNILNKADIIVTVSETWADFLKKRYGERVRVITNAYDEEDFKHVPQKPKDKFTISYLGKLNAAHQDISAFLNTLKDILRNAEIPRHRLRVNFYVSGYGKPDIESLARRVGLSDIINEYSPVPLKEALVAMKNSSLLLLVGWKGLSAEGWRPQKVYEYLGAGVPILLINGSENRELSQFISSTGSGSVANDLSSIKTELLRHYSNFAKMGESRITQHKDAVHKYNAFNVTKRLCSIIGEIKT